MSLNLASSLLPSPVSTSTRPSACSISRQRSARVMRLRSSAGMRFCPSGLGTTPNMAPPSRRWRPASRAWQVRRPTWKVVWVIRQLRTADCGLRIGNERSRAAGDSPWDSQPPNPKSAIVSQIVSPQRQRHAARTAATADQLAPLDGDHGPGPVPQGIRPRSLEQGRGRDGLEPRVLELAQGGLVAGVGDHHARPHGDEVAGRGPLLALLAGGGPPPPRPPGDKVAGRAPLPPPLEGAIGPAAEHRLERLIHRLHGGEKVRHLFYALRFLAPVQPREPPRSAGIN